MLPYIGFNEPGSFEGKIEKFSQNFEKKIEFFEKKKTTFFLKNELNKHYLTCLVRKERFIMGILWVKRKYSLKTVRKRKKIYKIKWGRAKKKFFSKIFISSKIVSETSSYAAVASKIGEKSAKKKVSNV